MGAAEGRMRDRIETGEDTVKALNFGARERLGERVSDHVSTLAVDEAKKLVMDHLLAEPVIGDSVRRGAACEEWKRSSQSS
jgi:hypothetical protein